MRNPLRLSALNSRFSSLVFLCAFCCLVTAGYSQEKGQQGDSSPTSGPAAALVPVTPSPADSSTAADPGAPVSDSKEDDSATRGMSKVPGSGNAAFKYGRRRAVIVGINYVQAGKNVGKTKAGLVARLKNAENDATAVHDVLKKLYGYQDGEISLLVGNAATRENISEQFESLLINNVEEEDSVLFFFSGHGIPYEDHSNRSSKVELVPFDYYYADDDSRPSHCLRLDHLVGDLQSKCKARHKLLVLDCCYAGSVFSQEVPLAAGTTAAPSPFTLGGRLITKADGIRSDDSVFKIHGFQAMTSSSLQPAGDSIKRGSTSGESQHSPFTDALLKSLDYLPRQKGAGAVLTTSQVFSGMQRYLDATLGENQTPRCSWLDAGQGEFHFFLEGDPPAGPQSEEDIQKNLIAMVPGSFGNWWFDECPWFLPGLRYRILDQTESSRSVLLDIRTPTQLKLAAERMLAILKEEVKADTRLLQQLDDMEKLMYGSSEIWQTNAQTIMKRLDEERRDPLKKQAMKGVDLHLLAVLRHALREEVVETRNRYREAISAYLVESEANHQSRAMLAMCQADFGWFEFDVAFDFDAASQHFADALSSYGAMTPQPFTAYVLCRDAEAQLRLGREAVAEQRLKKALSVIQEVDPDQKEPLSAAYYHRCAWVQMAGCKFGEASHSFQESSTILAKRSLTGEGPANQDIEATMMDLNNAHGMAQILRFQGERDQAISQYRTLYNKVIKHFRDRRDDDSRDSNYRQTKARLAEQLVNALEQMGDCSLFCYPTDAAEAADDYRRAIRTCGFLPEERQKRLEDRIRYKLALSLVLPGSPVHDAEMASLQLLQIGSAGQENGAKADVATSERGIHLCASLTRLLLAIDSWKKLQTAPGSNPLVEQRIHQILKGLRADLRKYLSEERLNKSLSRDDLEVSMFCLRTMLEGMKEDLERIDQTPAVTTAQRQDAEPLDIPRKDVDRLTSDSSSDNVLSSRLQRHNDLDMLLGFCRASRRGGKPVTTVETGGDGSQPRTMTLTGGDSLAFSRPYYDCAMRALIELKPSNAKQLIEVAHEAMTGDTHRKSAEPEATLTVYCTDSSCYVLLDVPRSTSKYFTLPGHINAESIRLALERNNVGKSRLDLPPEVYKELAIAALAELPVSVCWRDPVQKIGLSGTQEVVMAARPISPMNGEPALLPVAAETRTGGRNAEGLFPFRVPAGLQLLSVVPKSPEKGEQKVLTSVK